MIRYVLPLLLLTSPAIAEVCDRSRFSLNEWREADKPVQEPRIDFTYESGVIIHADGGRQTVYCVRNDAGGPIYFKWHGPTPDVLFESYALGHGYDSDIGKKSYSSTTMDVRTIEYYTSRPYRRQTDGEAIIFEGSVVSMQIVPVQATSLDLVGRSLPEVLTDADMLDRYLDAYRDAPEGGNELVIWSYARNWLPADSEVLAQLAAGEEIEGYEGPYIPVSYGLRSGINIDNRQATSSVLFWFGHFEENVEAFALASETNIRDGLSVVTASKAFEGLSGLEIDQNYPLSPAGVVLRQDVVDAMVGGGETAQIVPWTVGLAFEGIPFLAMQAELFAN